MPVEVEAVAPADLTRAVTTSTTLQSAREITVVAEVAGTVRELSAEAGDRVEAGRTLARIVNEELGIAAGEARTAVTRAEHEVARLRPLFEAGYLARQMFEQAEFELDVARTNLRRIETQGASQTVRTPTAGVVIQRSVERGEVVIPNQPLFVVADVDTLEARLAIPERELAAIAEGQPAEIHVEAFGDRVFSGVLSRIEPVVDPRTGTIEVRVALDPVEGPQALRPGMFASVRVITDVRPGVPAVPKRAVVREGGQHYVFVLGEPVERPPREGSGEPGPLDHLQPYAVRRVPTRLGYEDRDRVELLEGVSLGDRVVVVGQSGLDAGAVVVVPGEARAPAAGSGGRVPAPGAVEGSGEPSGQDG